MIEVNLTNCTYMGLIDPSRKHHLPLPANDKELDKLIEAESHFVDKYGYLTVTKKSHNRFRDYVCESKLGLVNGGYQQLKGIWKTLTPSLSNKNLNDMNSNIPNTIWGYIVDDEIFYFDNADGKILKIWELRFLSPDKSIIFDDYKSLSELHGCFHVTECANLKSSKEEDLSVNKIKECFKDYNFKVSDQIINWSSHVSDKSYECFYFKLERI